MTGILLLNQAILLILWYSVPAMVGVPLWVILLPSFPLIVLLALFVGVGLLALVAMLIERQGRVTIYRPRR